MDPPGAAHPRKAWLQPLFWLAAAAVVAGVAARFWGLGKWPLAIDEYYFERSVQNILRVGIPQYACGGYYVRGLLLQYATSVLQIAGLSPELAPRLIAAVSSLLTLPAAYMMARRVGGRTVALLALLLLALSVWEIEIARFGRMYAPFQALFAWYLWFYLAAVVDRDRRALVPLLILSLMGVLVWEGGAFLVIVNLLLPVIARPDGRLQRSDWVYLGCAALLILPIYPFVMADLLPVGAEPQYPADYVETPAVVLSRLDTVTIPWRTLRLHPWWGVLALLPAVLVLRAALQRLAAPTTWLNKLTWLAALGCVAFQQFALAAGMLAVALLIGIVDPQELRARSARSLLTAVVACLLFWTIFGLGTHDWRPGSPSLLHGAALLAYQFAAFPDLLRVVISPWVKTIPILAAGLACLLAAAFVRACLWPERTPQYERTLLLLFVTFLILVGMIHPPHQETRYVFFLYPAALIIALLTLKRLVRQVLGDAAPAHVALAGVALAAFALTEDFRPWHLLHIDSEEINFRIGMSGRLSSHYHPRSDIRSAAQWLSEHAQPGKDIIISSYPGVDFYAAADFYFMPETDPRFEVYSCRRGTVQRWSNLPLLHSFDALRGQIAQGQRIFLVLESGRMPQVTAQLPHGDWQLEWLSRARDIAILQVQARPPHG
jgi:hypothetical protein